MPAQFTASTTYERVPPPTSTTTGSPSPRSKVIGPPATTVSSEAAVLTPRTACAAASWSTVNLNAPVAAPAAEVTLATSDDEEVAVRLVQLAGAATFAAAVETAE